VGRGRMVGRHHRRLLCVVGRALPARNQRLSQKRNRPARGGPVNCEDV
jgi:hypothetical protein